MCRAQSDIEGKCSTLRAGPPSPCIAHTFSLFDLQYLHLPDPARHALPKHPRSEIFSRIGAGLFSAFQSESLLISHLDICSRHAPKATYSRHQTRPTQILLNAGHIVTPDDRRRFDDVVAARTSELIEVRKKNCTDPSQSEMQREIRLLHETKKLLYETLIAQQLPSEHAEHAAFNAAVSVGARFTGATSEDLQQLQSRLDPETFPNGLSPQDVVFYQHNAPQVQDDGTVLFFGDECCILRRAVRGVDRDETSGEETVFWEISFGSGQWKAVVSAQYLSRCVPVSEDPNREVEAARTFVGALAGLLMSPAFSLEAFELCIRFLAISGRLTASSGSTWLSPLFEAALHSQREDAVRLLLADVRTRDCLGLDVFNPWGAGKMIKIRCLHCTDTPTSHVALHVDFTTMYLLKICLCTPQTPKLHPLHSVGTSSSFARLGPPPLRAGGPWHAST